MNDNFEDFSGKVCVITGAASGIGRSLAIKLGKAGAILALSDVNEEGLKETAELAGGTASNRILITKLDVSDREQVHAYAGQVLQTFSSAGHVFNVAGLTRIGSFKDSSLEAMEQIMDVNYWGVVRMSKAFLPQLIETKGNLINISSLFGLIGAEGQAHYCASKFAVRGFSETIREELAPLGITVHTVHPGGVATNIAKNAKLDALPADINDKREIEERFAKVARTSSDKAASVILNGVRKKKTRIIVGEDAHVVSGIQRLFPTKYPAIFNRLFNRASSTPPQSK